jgi:hypothetical protein
MNPFIVLTKGKTGEPVLVNVEHITYVKPNDRRGATGVVEPGAILCMTGEDGYPTMHVSQSVDEVGQLIKALYENVVQQAADDAYLHGRNGGDVE